MSKHTASGDDQAPPPPEASKSKDDIPILPEPRRSLSRRFLQSIAIPLPKKAFLGWLIGLLVVGTALFVWVAVGTSAAVAFDVMLGLHSPIELQAGTAGIVLACFGYLLVPAAIGALVGNLYVNSSKLSGRSQRRREDDLYRQLHPGTGA